MTKRKIIIIDIIYSTNQISGAKKILYAVEAKMLFFAQTLLDNLGRKKSANPAI